MNKKSKSKFTLKIVLSYLILAILVIVSGYVIFSEIRIYMSNETSAENDVKLLQTGALLTQLYEAESLSKLALHNKTRKNFNAYAQKIDSIYVKIDTLKQLTQSDYQKKLLDSVQFLLQQKISNGNELRKLRTKNETNSSLDSAMKQFDKMEASFAKLTITDFEKHPEALSQFEKKVLQDWVSYLNNNIPEEVNTIKTDSIMNASRSILIEAKQKNTSSQRSLTRKEIEVTRNDLELSQQLQSIISSFDQEFMVNTHNDNIKKQAALRRGMRFTGFTAVLGLIIVGIFSFLITRDFWRVQTYREKLEKEKKFSESLLKSREQLISTVSHDLRTPLNTITGYTELIQGTGLIGPQMDYLTNVKSASRYVERLVNDLLDFSKLEAKRIKIEKKPFVLSHLLRETAENLKEIHNNKPIELILQIDKELDHSVLGDPLRIRQIITNLIGNSYKFTKKGFVKIEATLTPGTANSCEAIIKIIDSGIGIKKEKQELIFNEFIQGDTNTENKYGGYGLGLTISKKLTELLGGTLSLESEENKGSTLTLSVPLEVSEIAINLIRTEILRSKKELSILILDDDPSMLRLLEDVCESLQIKAHVFSNFEAIKENMGIVYDAVLTDIQMRNITGFEVLKKLRSERYEHYGNQPIIAMTGRRDLTAKDYAKTGFTGMLQKPFSKTRFIEVLQQLFPDHFYSKNGRKHLKKVEISSNLFDLEMISPFLNNDKDAISEVLNTFLSDTGINLNELKVKMEHKDQKAINNIAHKMLPMFRQLKSQEIVPILEDLEQLSPKQLEAKELMEIYLQLENKIAALQLAIQSFLTINPS